jgi:hypothetical protein
MALVKAIFKDKIIAQSVLAKSVEEFIMFTGSCLCKAITFEAQETPNLVFNCHCSRCRKSHGSAFATQVFASKASLNFTSGHEKLSEYQSTGGVRTFCSICGSRLMNYAANGNGDYLSVAISAIDEPHQFAPIADCFVSNKAPWSELDTNIEQYSELPNL